MTPEADEMQAHRVIIKLALMLAHLRAVVSTYQTYRTQGSEYQYNLRVIEDPSRAMTQMRNLAKGHALSQGRRYITMDDIPVVMHMALSTTTVERVRVFELLIEHEGTLTTSIICKSLGAAPATARKTMVELRVAGLVDYTISPEEEERNNIEMGVILKDEFKWFLSNEFAEIKEALLKEKYPLV